MSEKSQYAEMLEIPVTTTNIVTKPKKTRRKKTAPPEELKEQLINEVNAEMAEESAAAEAALAGDVSIVDAGHFSSELPIAEAMAQYLQQEEEGLQVYPFTAQTNPFQTL